LSAVVARCRLEARAPSNIEGSAIGSVVGGIGGQTNVVSQVRVAPRCGLSAAT
jgi:hypothetical protein